MFQSSSLLKTTYISINRITVLSPKSGLQFSNTFRWKLNLWSSGTGMNWIMALKKNQELILLFYFELWWLLLVSGLPHHPTQNICNLLPESHTRTCQNLITRIPLLKILMSHHKFYLLLRWGQVDDKNVGEHWGFVEILLKEIKHFLYRQGVK